MVHTQSPLGLAGSADYLLRFYVEMRRLMIQFEREKKQEDAAAGADRSVEQVVRMDRSGFLAVVTPMALAALSVPTLAQQAPAVAVGGPHFSIDSLSSALDVSGELSGDGLSHPETVDVKCSKTDAACVVLTITEVAPKNNVLGGPDWFDVKRWDVVGVIAKGRDETCLSNTIAIDFSARQLSWTRLPTHPIGTDCSGTDRRGYIWTLTSPSYENGAK